MLDNPIILKLLDIPEDIDEPNAYDLLGLTPDTVSDELVDYQLTERRKKLRQNIPGPQFIPIIAAFEKELVEAAEILRDEKRRTQVDLEIEARAEQAKHEDRVAQLRRKVRTLIAAETDENGCLPDEKRAALQKKLESMGLTNVAVILDKIPRPASETKNTAKELAIHFASSVDLVLGNGHLSPQEEEKLLEMAKQLGLSDKAARKVIEVRLKKTGAQRGDPADDQIQAHRARFEKRVHKQCPNGKATERDWKRLVALAAVDGLTPEAAETILASLLGAPVSPRGKTTGVKRGPSRKMRRAKRLKAKRQSSAAPIVIAIFAIAAIAVAWTFLKDAKEDREAEAALLEQRRQRAPAVADDDKPDAAPATSTETKPSPQADAASPADGDGQSPEEATPPKRSAGAQTAPTGRIRGAIVTPALQKSFTPGSDRDGVLADTAVLLYATATEINHIRRGLALDAQALLSALAPMRSIAGLTKNYQLTTVKEASSSQDAGKRAARIAETVSLLTRSAGRTAEHYHAIQALLEADRTMAQEAFLKAMVELAGESRPADTEAKTISRLLRVLCALPDPSIPRQLAPLISKTDSEWTAFTISRALLKGIERETWGATFAGVDPRHPRLNLTYANDKRARANTAFEWKMKLNRRTTFAPQDGGGPTDANPAAAESWQTSPTPIKLVGALLFQVRNCVRELDGLAWGKTEPERDAVPQAPAGVEYLSASGPRQIDQELSRYVKQVERLVGASPALTSRKGSNKDAAGLRLESEMIVLEQGARMALCRTFLQRQSVRLQTAARLLEVLLLAGDADGKAAPKVAALRRSRRQGLANPRNVLTELRANAASNLACWELLTQRTTARP